MFATKSEAVNWINEFSNGLQLEPRKVGNVWRIYDADGFSLSEERIAEIEGAAA